MERGAFIKQCEEGFKGIDQKNVERARELLELEIQLLSLLRFHRNEVCKVKSYIDDAIDEHRHHLPVELYFRRAKAFLMDHQSNDEKILQLNLVLALFKYSAFKQYCSHKGFVVEVFNVNVADIDAFDGNLLEFAKKFDFSRMRLDSMVLNQFSPRKDMPSFEVFNQMVIENTIRNNLKDIKVKDQKARADAEFKIRLNVLKDVIMSSVELQPCDRFLFVVGTYTKEVSMFFNVSPNADTYKLYLKINSEVEKIKISGVTIGYERCANLGDQLMLTVDFTYEGLDAYELPLDFSVLDRLSTVLS